MSYPVHSNVTVVKTEQDACRLPSPASVLAAWRAGWPAGMGGDRVDRKSITLGDWATGLLSSE